MRPRCYVLFLLISLLGCAKKPADPESDGPQETPKVKVLKLTPQTWHQTIRTFGVFEAAEQVTISGEFSGKVNGVFFAEGQEITAGDKLVEFDISERRMQFKQAEGNLAGAKAKLEEARSQAERREGLFKQKVISKEQLEMARSALAGIEAQYEQLLVGRSLARHQLKRTRLMSPVSGKVVTKSIDVGEIAMPGQTLAVIHVTDTMRVVTHVTEQEINTVQVGARCTVTTPGVRGRVYEAHVESIGNEADRITGNFPLKLAVQNKDGLLKAGMTAIVTLEGLAVKDTIVIPDTAVVDRNRKQAVYLAQEGRAKEVTPVLAASTGELLPVLHGLKAGEALIVEGLNNVVNGTEINVTGTSEITPPAPPENGGTPEAPEDNSKTVSTSPEELPSRKGAK